jgi:hypothetical protein
MAFQLFDLYQCPTLLVRADRLFGIAFHFMILYILSEEGLQAIIAFN